MRRPNYILAAILTIGVIAVAFQAYSRSSTLTMLSSPSFAPGPTGIDYPNPISQNVTVMGVMTASVVSPACALSNPPCSVADSPLYYVTVGGWNYRLIFQNSTAVPVNHAHIVVTGVFVTPSTFQASLWTPQIYFRGDIYVQTYSYVFPY